MPRLSLLVTFDGVNEKQVFSRVWEEIARNAYKQHMAVY